MHSSIFARRWAGAVFWLLSGLSLCAAATTVSHENAYGAIARRNVFGLSPVPDSPLGLWQSKPGPRILLTGVTDILGERVALLKLEFPAKPPETPKERYLILAEGQREGDLGVVRVDVRRGTVAVLQAGNVTTLSLEREGASLPEAPPPGSGASTPPRIILQ